MRWINKSIANIVLFLLLLAGFNASGQDVQTEAIKYGRLLRLIETFYVDTANVSQLTESAIIKVLAELDPHSVYISKEEVKEMNEPLQGNFEGIGISFNIYQDTLIVLTTIPGGPSEKVGLRPSDRIIEVDGKNIAGIGLTNQNVFDMLRGKKGTRVDLKVSRKNQAGLLDFTIIRDKIPIYSLDAAYMLNRETAYVKLNRFGATTIDEYETAMQKLQKENNVKNLILDLRGNGGGYLRAAIDLADHVLPSNRLIVYTEGIHSPKREYKSTTKGNFEEGKVIVLINEGSASASEIVAGAVQDWDRGILIGRRTFGKGLVQQPFMLNDGSMIRLTTAHYFTPAGRNIQKPYENGVEEYRNEYFERLARGEFFSRDSIHLADSLMVKTLVNQRSVYNGGGIMPDIFVPLDTSIHYQYFNTLIRKNVLFPFVIGYLDQNRAKLIEDYNDLDSFLKNYRVSDSMMDDLVAAGEKEDVEKDEEGLAFADEIIRRQLKALIGRDLYERGTYFQIMNEDDEEIQKALELLNSNKLYVKYLE